MDPRLHGDDKCRFGLAPADIRVEDALDNAR
jgi:hypothetical protein